MWHIRFQWKLQLLLQLSISLSVANCCFLPRSHATFRPEPSITGTLNFFPSSTCPSLPVTHAGTYRLRVGAEPRGPANQNVSTKHNFENAARATDGSDITITLQGPWSHLTCPDTKLALTPNLPYPLQLKITLSRWVRVRGGRERWGVTASLISGCVSLCFQTQLGLKIWPRGFPWSEAPPTSPVIDMWEQSHCQQESVHVRENTHSILLGRKIVDLDHPKTIRHHFGIMVSLKSASIWIYFLSMKR